MLPLDKIKSSLLEPIQRAEKAWLLQTAPVLMASINEQTASHALNATFLDTASDRTDQEKLEMLEGFLGRSITDEEGTEWLALISGAGNLAAKRRKLIVLAMDHAEYREYKIVSWPSHFTDATILAFKLHDKRTRYPVARLVPKPNKDVERAKMVQELVDFAVSLGLPVVSVVLEAVNSGTILSRIAGGRRISTLKQKLLTLRRLSEWTQAVHGQRFPSRPYMLMDYLEERAAEPCGPSVPSAVWSAVKFIEQIGGAQEGNRVGNYSIIESQVRDLELALRSDDPRPKRTAPLMLLCFVAYWEHEVACLFRPITVRVTCFVKLLRIWGSLRSSDLTQEPQVGCRWKPDWEYHYFEDHREGQGSGPHILPHS
jgi:hypothetical protein